MTENIPPSTGAKLTTTTTSSGANTSDRGIPYYESLRRSLRDTIARKRSLDRNLSQLEDQIHRAETTYLEETSAAGNIVKGFDNYIKAAATATGGAASSASGTISGSQAGGTRRKAVVSDTDRVFSRSSANWRDGAESGPASAVSTPGAARVGTPVVVEKEVTRKKKKSLASAAAAAGDDDETTKTTKRQKISFTRKGHDD